MEVNIRGNNFYELDVWKQGHALVLAIYSITKSFPSNEQFGITSQMRRAASSVTANIAEGYSRYYFKDKIRFYYMSRGSAAEVQNFLMISKDLGMIEQEVFVDLIDKLENIAKLINGLIRSTEGKVLSK